MLVECGNGAGFEILVSLSIEVVLELLAYGNIYATVFVEDRIADHKPIVIFCSASFYSVYHIELPVAVSKLWSVGKLKIIQEHQPRIVEFAYTVSLHTFNEEGSILAFTSVPPKPPFPCIHNGKRDYKRALWHRLRYCHSPIAVSFSTQIVLSLTIRKQQSAHQVAHSPIICIALLGFFFFILNLLSH